MARDAWNHHLPEFVTEKEKSGWTAPVAHWADYENLHKAKGRLAEFTRSIVNPEYYPPVNGLLSFKRLILSGPKRIPALMFFLIWAKKMGMRL